MTAEQLSRAAGVLAVAAALVVALCAGARTDAAQKEKAGEKKAKPLRGASICKDCHENENPTKKALYQETKGFEFVRLQENLIWGEHDLHAKAGENLKNALGQTMSQRLRVIYSDLQYSAVTDKNCLACHASLNDPEIPLAARNGKSFLVGEGVGCEMCHGHGRDYESPHQLPGEKFDEPNAFGATREVAWRGRSSNNKMELKFVNLRDPQVSSHKCASCHVGNMDEGKFITHDMYVAGHPPLPPLDVMAFTRDQPRHWGLPREMPYLKLIAEKEPDKAWKHFRYRKETEEVYAARRFAVTTIATLRSSLDLFKQQALEAKGRGGLDFANFDCYSCHHTLKYPSDRQTRGYAGLPPGRPLFRPATFALARIVVHHAASMKNGDQLAAEMKKLADAEGKLAEAFTTRTFGDPEKIPGACETLTKWCSEVLAKLDGVRYSRQDTVALMKAITVVADGPLADPEVAQLYAAAFETLRIELRDTGDKKDPEGWAEARAELAKAVVTRLRSKLPEGEVRPDDKLPPTNVEDSVESRLERRLELINSFKPSDFRTAFAKMSKLLPK